MPKTPEGCPHGNALLALGLGDGGRGTVRLCDAFRGGGVTHELSTHAGGGVNAVAWDPCHPFRLVSGGDDFTVRLWDIRKSDSAACLGILDQEHSMNDGGDSGYANYDRSQKRQKDTINSSQRRFHGIQSHSGTVTALAFVPNGEDLVTSGLDWKIQNWDLRPESCFVCILGSCNEQNWEEEFRGWS
jgi:WD40 repeat protein